MKVVSDPAVGAASPFPFSMNLSLLDNIAWHAMTGPQAAFAVGAGNARRYAPGFAPIVAFADIVHPDFRAIDAYCSPDEPFYTIGWAGAASPEWRVEQDSTMFQMVWTGPPLDAADEAVAPIHLGKDDVSHMLRLVALTHPGPFGPRSVELGDYFGCFVGTRLVAMAAERMHADTLREISAVCTHPEFQGRGLARRLVEALIRHEVSRDETPFLHVMRDNVGALRMYERMGFRRHQEVPVRVIVRCAP